MEARSSGWQAEQHCLGVVKGSCVDLLVVFVCALAVSMMLTACSAQHPIIFPLWHNHKQKAAWPRAISVL